VASICFSASHAAPHAQDTVDAKPRVPEASVGVVHFAFGPRDAATLIVRCQRSSSTVQFFCFTLPPNLSGASSFVLPFICLHLGLMG
jgi:hypothetical protein